MDPSRSIVRLEKAAKEFAVPEGGSVLALNAIDLDVARNEFLTLLGPSGCGKTTLLHAISGFVQLDSGRISIDGSDVTDRPPHRRPVNTVFQNYALFPHMNIDSNVGYSLDISGVGRDERRRRVGEALELVGLAGMGNRFPRQLSGGQQQRVALARAIVARPKLLLLDEPLSALDRNLRQSMQIELKSLQAELGISFIFVTHDQEEALTMSDRIAVLNKGDIQQIGAPGEVYDQPANVFVATFVGQSNLFRGAVARNGKGVDLQSDDGVTIRAGAVHDLPDNRKATALIRPEQLSLASGKSDRKPSIDVTIDQIVFSGLNFQLHGRTASGKPILAIVPASDRAAVAGLTQGDAARLVYDPQAVHLIGGDAGRLVEEAQ